MATVLFVEDESRLAETVQLFLQQQGHTCHIAADGVHGLQMAMNTLYDVICLDWMLPGIDGISLCEVIKSIQKVKVILITAKSEINDRVHGLEQGADDYMTKPFSLRELSARIKAILRTESSTIPFGDHALTNSNMFSRILSSESLEANVNEYNVEYDGIPIALTLTEFKLLEILMEHPKTVFSQLQLAEQLGKQKGENGFKRHTITTHLSNLRKKIQQASGVDLIKNVYRIGYKFDGDVTVKHEAN